MKRIIIECVPAEFDDLFGLLKEEFPKHQIYGWDEAFHYTVTPQEMRKFIRIFNAIEMKRYQDIQKADWKIIHRLKDLFREALD